MIKPFNNLSASANTSCDECTEEVLCEEHLTNDEFEKVSQDNDFVNKDDGEVSPNVHGGIIVEDENDEGIFLLGFENESENH